MYRVIIKTSGKYNNVATGARYCITQRSAIKMAAQFHMSECDYEVEKFVRLHGDIFAWSAHEIGEKFWEKMWDIVEKDLDNDDDV